ncbi:recombinase family protein [Micromonospora echinofusca]|uniref:hypothetical protein n=1 Tax=Micromonospora echinofusca TaxID=47858 RepID=UPI000B5AE9D4|nr:hypothetical protein [Micromonospora echinofusca]
MNPTLTRRTAEGARTWFDQVRAAGESDQPVPDGTAAAMWRRMTPEVRAMTTAVVEDLLGRLTMDDEPLRGTCPACQAGIGETHADDCEVAECLVRGVKRMYCRALADTGGHDCGASTWTGDWPGHREAREFGWHVRWDAEAQRWERCSPDVEGSGPDLNRLYEHARWDPSVRRWRRCRAVLFARAVRGGRATVEELTKVADRWCAEQGYEVVGSHIGTRGWREAVADVDEGSADLVVVPSVDRLGFGKQVFERIAAVRAAGGDIAGPGVRIDREGSGSRLVDEREVRKFHDGAREAGHPGVPADEHQRPAGGHGRPRVRADRRPQPDAVRGLWHGHVDRLEPAGGSRTGAGRDAAAVHDLRGGGDESARDAGGGRAPRGRPRKATVARLVR